MSTSSTPSTPSTVTVPAAPGPQGVAPNQQAVARAIDLSKILVRAMPGYLYSPVTKCIYYVNNLQPVGPSTFERPWSVNLGYSFERPVYPLNPVDYCTPETADAVLQWARNYWPQLIFDIYAPTPDGYVTVPQFWLLVTNGSSLYEVYSAGWWAFDYDKDGDAAAFQQRNAELKAAGFSV